MDLNFVFWIIFHGILTGQANGQVNCLRSDGDGTMATFNWDKNYSLCNVTLKIGACSTCDSSRCTTATGMCRFPWVPSDKFHLDNHFQLYDVSSCENLTDTFCGPFNRIGKLCTKCKPGYGPSPYAHSLKCLKCRDNYKGWLWLLYVLLELVPLTIFYLLLITFNVHATSPPFTSFILFCQLFTKLLRDNTYINLYLRLYANNFFLYSVLTIINVWNLDLFRYIVPQFCVSSKLRDMDVLLLQLVSGMFPLLLVSLTYIGIELHARNFLPVVFLWRPFHRWFAKFRRSWDPRSSVIAGFATFLFLSSAKIQFIVYELYFPMEYIENGTEYMASLYNPELSVIKDNSLYIHKLFSTQYFIALVIISILVNSPVVLFLFYPTKFFRRLLSCVGFHNYRIICVFADAFQGHYKDGTNGTRDYRVAFFLNYFFRIVYNLTLCQYSARLGRPKVFTCVMVYSFVAMSLFYAIVQPCKKRYMNVAESLIYATAALIFLNLFAIDFAFGTGRVRAGHTAGLIFTLILVMLPSLVFGGIFFSRCVVRTGLHWNRWHWNADRSRSGTTTDVIPDRVVHPLDYIPIP